MPSLPPFTEEIRDRAHALTAIRARVAEGRRLDPVDGCHEEPWLEIGTPAALGAFAVAVLGGLATIVTVFFTRGPVFLALLGVTVVAAITTKVLSAKEIARIRRNRSASRVVLGARAYMVECLSRPGTSTGEAVFVLDLAADDSPERVSSVALKLGNALHARGKGAADPGLPPGIEQLDGTWNRIPLDPAWAGARDMHVARFSLDPALLPRRAADREVWPMLVNPDDPVDSVAPLPPAFWWREDVEALLQPR